MEKVAVFDGCNDQNVHYCQSCEGVLHSWSLDGASVTRLQQLPGEQGQEEAQVECAEIR